jgi:hypothetical protein
MAFTHLTCLLLPHTTPPQHAHAASAFLRKSADDTCWAYILLTSAATPGVGLLYVGAWQIKVVANLWVIAFLGRICACLRGRD